MSGPDAAPLPTVSVVIPCHDAEPFLAAAVDSVLAQKGVGVEVIVVDDASSDGSVGVARAYGDRIRRIELPVNRGACAARNAGAAAACGDALMFLDADDVVTPGTLAALASALSRAPGAIAGCEFRRLRRGPDGWAEVPVGRPLLTEREDPLHAWLHGAWIATCSLLWSRAAWERSGGWDETLSQNEDGDIAMRALARGVPVVRADGGLGLYRDHGGDRLTVSSDIFSERRVRSQVTVMDNLRAELEASGRLDRYADAIGLAFHRIALTAFRAGFPEIGRACLAKGRALAGERAVSRTWIGRTLDRLVGIERKERIVAALARQGVATRAQRRMQRLRTLAGRTS
jgi:O-antigen biosynthesis protein